MNIKELDNNINNTIKEFNNYEDSISYLRGLLDSITIDLVNILMKRTIIVKKVGDIKKMYNKPFVVKSREDDIMKNIDSLVYKKNKELYKLISVNFDSNILKKLMRDLINFALKIEK